MSSWVAEIARSNRRTLRTRTGRRADDLRRAIGAQIAQLRQDANISKRRLAEAGGIPQSFLSRIERGLAEPSLAVLVAIGGPLGADLSLRLHPGAGPRIRDRLKAPITEELIRRSRGGWRSVPEVSVWRPARGVIDVVLARPAEIVVAVEIQSEIRRLEQHIRWAKQKAESMPSCEAWPMLSGGAAETPISRLLILRSTKTTRELVRTYSATFASEFPARSIDAVRAIADPDVPWPGAALVWASSVGGHIRLLDVPPREIDVGR